MITITENNLQRAAELYATAHWGDRDENNSAQFDDEVDNFITGINFLNTSFSTELSIGGVVDTFCDCPQPHRVSTTEGGTKCVFCGNWIFKQN